MDGGDVMLDRGSPPDDDGAEWSASEVQDASVSEPVDQLIAGLRELGADAAEIAAARALLSLSDPLTADQDQIRDTLMRLGATEQVARHAVTDLNEIRDANPVPPGGLLDWGKDPDDTLKRLTLEAAAEAGKRRRRRLKTAVLEALGFDVPVGEPHFEEAIITILVLAAPAVDGARVVWKSTDSNAVGAGFDLTLFGSGLGANRTIAIESSRTETCEKGDARVIRLIAPVLAQPLGRRRDGRVDVVGYKRELAEAGPGVPLRRFDVDHVDEPDLAALAGPAVADEDRSDELESAELSDSGAVSGERKLTVGLTYKDVNATLSATLQQTRSFEVVSTLPGGHCYRRYYPASGFGIMWEMRTR